MAQMESFRPLPVRHGSTGGVERAHGPFAGLAGTLVRKSREMWNRHRDEKQLQALSDHQLRDLGISRLDIARVVRRGFDR